MPLSATTKARLEVLRTKLLALSEIVTNSAAGYVDGLLSEVDRQLADDGDELGAVRTAANIERLVQALSEAVSRAEPLSDGTAAKSEQGGDPE